MIRATKNGKKQEGDGTEEGNGEQGLEGGNERQREKEERSNRERHACD